MNHAPYCDMNTEMNPRWHREALPMICQRYIGLDRTLTIEQSAKKVRRMMMDAIQEKRQSVPQEGRES